MLELIICCGIIYFIIKKASNKKIVVDNSMLIANGFSKITQISEDQKQEYCSAIKNGDNYLILFIRSEKYPYISDINDLTNQMQARHFHYGIIVSLEQPTDRIKQYAKSKSIQIKTVVELNSAKLKSNKNKQDSVIKNKRETINSTYDEAIITYETPTSEIQNDEEPIREMKKTSAFGELFKKPNRL